jgi:hypothetical protein
MSPVGQDQTYRKARIASDSSRKFRIKELLLVSAPAEPFLSDQLAERLLIVISIVADDVALLVMCVKLSFSCMKLSH